MGPGLGIVNKVLELLRVSLPIEVGLATEIPELSSVSMTLDIGFGSGCGRVTIGSGSGVGKPGMD